jgi:hypothetical protein
VPLTKTWLTTGRKPRQSHAAIAGQTVGIGETFGNGLQFPGDPTMGPEEGANCSCIVILNGQVSTKLKTGINPVWDARLERFYVTAPKARLEAFDDTILGPIRRLRQVNGNLDDLSPKVRAQVENIDELVTKYGHVFDDDEVLWRGVDDADDWFKPEVGARWKDDGYTFTTMDDEIAAGYTGDQGWTIQFAMKQGDMAMPYPRHQAMVLPRGKEFQIISVDRKARVVVMRSVDDVVEHIDDVPMSEAAREAFRGYADDYTGGINARLRAGGALEPDDVLRDSMMRELPDDTPTLYRTFASKDPSDELFNGKKYVDDGYMSTTTDLDVARDYADEFGGVMLEVRPQPGVRAFNYQWDDGLWDEYAGQAEVLFERGCTFSVHRDGSRLVMDVFPPETRLASLAEDVTARIIRELEKADDGT